jgi:hypothetical protein
MAMETMAVAKVIGTYKILERWVGSINAGRAHPLLFGQKLLA